MVSEKTPVPVPLVSFITPDSPISGVLSVEEYITPLSVTAFPLSEVILPPMTVEVLVIAVAVEVEISGANFKPLTEKLHEPVAVPV